MVVVTIVVAGDVGLVDLGDVVGGGAIAVEEAEVVAAEAEEEVNIKLSCILLNFLCFCLGGRGGGQRSGAIQEFAGTKMTFDDSD